VRAPLFPVLLGILLAGSGCARSDAESPSRAPLTRESATAPVVQVSTPFELTAAASPTLQLDRDPQPEPPPQTGSIVLAAGGDVNFGRECGQLILKDPSYAPLAGLSSAWSSADARFVNLESQLSDQGGITQSPRHRLIFTGPPGGAEVLVRSGISLVSTANNHAWDYGKRALLETIDNLERAKLEFAGTGRDPEQAYRPAILRVKGQSLALFAVTQVWNQPPFATHEGKDHVAWADAERLRSGIERARREHDFVLVSYHGGEEYSQAPVERTKRFVSAVMALGVDAVLGHHPHVPQGVGFVGARPVLYSLGNLVFAGHQEKPWTLQSFFARLTLRKGAPPELSACPYFLDGHRPHSFEPGRQALAIELFRRHLLATSIYTGGVDVAPPDAFGCLRVTPRNAQPSLSSSN
jgi:poly-gamma-glutamate capsule biosynthesis protein CapA/YwtB (metallophosphatase superfamily)